jgi:hypothetical protein
MAASTLLPESESLELAELIADDAGVTMVVRACRPTACCPDCGVPATRVHSRYQRRLAVMWTNVKPHGCPSFSRPVCPGRSQGKPGRRLTV